MTGTMLETALRRDRTIVLVALALLAALSWLYLFRLAGSMNMSEMAMPEMRGATLGWSAADFIYVFTMWVVMMVGMMSPSVAPMVLIYARVGRQAALQGKPLAATGFFVGGYLFAWAGFSLAATVGQWGLQSTMLLSPAMASTSAVLSGLLLMIAGIYQWTPQKDICLSHCQTPLAFIQKHGGFRRYPLGSWSLGLRHGLYCVGCCWALMALLFVLGVMNIAWIAALAIFVLLEKVVPAGKLLSRTAGTVLFVAGAWMLGGVLT